MKPFLLLVLSIVTITTFAQKDTSDIITVSNHTDTTLYETVEIEAEFPGGQDGWREYLMKNIRMNEIVSSIPRSVKHFMQQAIVEFIVDTDGSISNIKVINDVSPAVAREAKRIIARSPRWIPAVQNGRKVKAYRKQPIIFAVNNK